MNLQGVTALALTEQSTMLQSFMMANEGNTGGVGVVGRNEDEGDEMPA